ncbi:hypothetical protein [Alteromonas sp. CYL-A6]|uniref:hypothetical protein n=1 Tax=Alteromonas nitratireducens TaxID=3390813 RepID=UPI0034B9144B
MISFSIIGILSLLLIYFVLRFQNVQRELVVAQGNAKALSKRTKYALRTVLLLASEQQQDIMGRLETANSKGLIKAKDYEHLHTLFSYFTDIVMACCEKDATVEEAIKFVLRGKDTSLQDVKDVIKNMPSEVRLSWSRNTAESFISACGNIARSFMGKTESSKNQEPAGNTDQSKG